LWCNGGYKNMMTCSKCNNAIYIELMPDYASSGFWCKYCGMSFADPKNDLPYLSSGIIDLVEGWNLLWELGTGTSIELNKPNFEILFRKMGKKLEGLVGLNYLCIFDETKPIFYT
jgi:hypothetical protein